MMTDSHDAAEYVLRRSWRARRSERNARWLVGLAVRRLNQGVPPDKLAELLQMDVRASVNPMWASVIINLLLPIVVQLILAWWERRNAE